MGRFYLDPEVCSVTVKLDKRGLSSSRRSNSSVGQSTCPATGRLPEPENSTKLNDPHTDIQIPIRAHWELSIRPDVQVLPWPSPRTSTDESPVPLFSVLFVALGVFPAQQKTSQPQSLIGGCRATCQKSWGPSYQPLQMDAETSIFR